jgi:parallel beta-helix repeat protein
MLAGAREMGRRRASLSLALTFLLLSAMLSVVLDLPLVRGSETIYIRADGSVEGTIYIVSSDNVTYVFTADINDLIVVERSNIIIDGVGYTLQGAGSGSGFSLSNVSNVTIKNTNIEYFYYGIELSESSNNSISGNNITNNWYGGIGLWDSNYNSISGNHITNNRGIGIMLAGLFGSSNNSVAGNVFVNDGLYVWSSYRNVVVDNLVNGKPLVYLEEVSDYVVGDAGQVILVNCNRIRVENLNLSNTYIGVQLWRTRNTTISGNNITNNSHGIWLHESSNYNNISGNNITNNSEVGIRLIMGISSNYNSIVGNYIINNNYGIETGVENSIYHNNFINNTEQVHVFYSGYANVWDDDYPSGGNYWSDYTGVDADGDGIGDAAYVIDADNRDRYPLVFPLVWDYSNPIPVIWVGAIYPVALSSNSTISGFRFNHLQKQISFNLTGSSGATGYCNVTIPKALLVDSQWTITINGVPKTDYTKTENVTHTFLYFTYTHASTSHVIIQGTSVIPEFPQFIILPLFMVLTLLAVVLARKSLLKKTKNLNSQTPFF